MQLFDAGCLIGDGAAARDRVNNKRQPRIVVRRKARRRPHLQMPWASLAVSHAGPAGSSDSDEVSSDPSFTARYHRRFRPDPVSRVGWLSVYATVIANLSNGRRAAEVDEVGRGCALAGPRHTMCVLEERRSVRSGSQPARIRLRMSQLKSGSDPVAANTASRGRHTRTGTAR